FHLTQTSVAILGVSGVIFLITMHHRREGHLLTQTQEEMLLIACFGLFWMAALLGWHALRAQGADPTSGLSMDAGVKAVRERPVLVGTPGQQVRPYPCSVDDAYCIVEDYTFF
ncbi:hypothetical protein DFH09DRAFT_902085, partial [Mycena vulgaris]